VPVVDHDFLDSFSLDVETKASRFRQLLHELPAVLSDWAVHPGLGDTASREIATVGELVTPILNS
jgi:chitin disaccharide deacetylase